MQRPPSPGLYVHVPFCRSRCSYCDFVSGTYPREVQEAYLTALGEELRQRSAGFDAPFRTVYIGGGSPSSLDDDLWADLLELLRPAGDGGECSVEMNP